MTFDAAGADEEREDDVAPGRDLASLLAAGMERRGFRLSEGVEEHDSYGWYFIVATAESEGAWCMLQLSDAWLVITKLEHQSAQPRAVAHAQTRLHTVCAALHDAAKEIAAISNIRWFSETEFRDGAEGASHP
jgi:hypothetical protein